MKKENDIRLTPAALSALASGDFVNALVAATPGGIEIQEAQGQQQLVNSSKLPAKKYARETLEKFGVVFGEEDEDQLFVNVTLPDGWKLKATDHSMWSDLLDEQGRMRAAIFYKAAFYDRRASLTLVRRIKVDTGRVGENKREAKVVVNENDKELVLTSYEKAYTKSVDDPFKPEDDAAEFVQKQAFDWLAEHYPDWQDLGAYWDIKFA